MSEDGEVAEAPASHAAGTATPSAALASACKGMLRLRKLVHCHKARAAARREQVEGNVEGNASPQRTAAGRLAHTLDELWLRTDEELDELLGVRLSLLCCLYIHCCFAAL